MSNISLNSDNNQLVVTIDTSDLDQDYLFKVVEKIELEVLAQKARVEEDTLDIAEQISRDWWRENKNDYLKGVKR
ncbi:MAG: hypothetical protein WA958_19575 [Tunicatimonas sp.]